MSRSDTSASFLKDQVTAAVACVSETRHPMPKMKGTPYQCSVLGCPSANSPVGLWLFSLPCKDTEPALRATWLERLPLTADQPHSPRVCFRHFAEQDFVQQRQCIVGLKRMAVPVKTGSQLGSNHRAACGMNSAASGAERPETTALGVGTLRRQGTAPNCVSLRGHAVGPRGNPRVQAHTVYRPLQSKLVDSRLGGLLEENANADALAFDGRAAAMGTSAPSTRIFAEAEKGNAVLRADSLGALSKCVRDAGFGHSSETSTAHAGTVPSGVVNLPTSHAGLPASAVGAGKSSAAQHQRGTQLSSSACSGGSYCNFGAPPSSLFDPFAAWTGLAGALNAYAHLLPSSGGSVLPGTEGTLDGNSAVVSASSGRDFYQPTDPGVKIDCSVDSTVLLLNPAVPHSTVSSGMTSCAGKVPQVCKEGQPRASVGSGSVEGVAESPLEGGCADPDSCTADSGCEAVEPVVAEEATLFDPSMGTYVIEKETLSDEDCHGTSAIRFRISWAPSSDAVENGASCKSARPKAPSSGKPSSSGDGPASDFCRSRRKTS